MSTSDVEMLRRLHGDPVPPENFIVADIDVGNLSEDQSEPRSPDADWPEERVDSHRHE